MRILVIGDTHIPAVHPGYRRFCQDLYSKYKCQKAIHIGDLVDWHAVSFHDKHPDAKGAKQEYEEAEIEVKKWYKAFPKLHLCEGNHDQRIIRAASKAGIPTRFVKGYNEQWDTPSWKWASSFTEDDAHYVHGTGNGGNFPAFNLMSKLLMSVVSGHIHTAAGIWWRANPTRRIFGMNVGTGVNDKHLSFAYAENVKLRSILSAGVLIDGTPMHIVMPCGPGERYHSSRF